MRMISFISRQSNIKTSVIELFHVKGKQKDVSSNSFTTQTCVKKISVTYIMLKYITWLIG